MIEFKVIDYHIKEYQQMLKQLSDFEEWKLRNPNEYEWNYVKEVPTKSRLKRTRMIINNLMMKIENK